MLVHALWRSVVLVLLAVFLTSAWSKQTEWVFTNVLAQIGLGYPVLFALAFCKPTTQWLVAIGILLAYWLAFALYPTPGSGFDWTAVGVPSTWPHFSGFAAHWEKNANLAADFDRWFLNFFPREAPFRFSNGGYQTLNFVPSLATMVFGLLTGQLLRGEIALNLKLKRLVVAALGAMLFAQAVALGGLCPIVKRIWTPSWAIYSAGWAALFLCGFMAIIEWRGLKRWALPFIVAGLNPIALYCMWQLMGGFVRENIKRHAGQNIFEILGTTYAPLLQHASVLFIYWLILLWMHRRRIYLRF